MNCPKAHRNLVQLHHYFSPSKDNQERWCMQYRNLTIGHDRIAEPQGFRTEAQSRYAVSYRDFTPWSTVPPRGSELYDTCITTTLWIYEPLSQRGRHEKGSARLFLSTSIDKPKHWLVQILPSCRPGILRAWAPISCNTCKRFQMFDDPKPYKSPEGIRHEAATST